MKKTTRRQTPRSTTSFRSSRSSFTTTSPASSSSSSLTVWQVVSIVLVMVLAFALRIFWLDKAPKGALIDEAHFGYIAYSLVETGKDEHGVPWPIIFKGFGDQKLPAYGYALVPVVKVLGLSTFAIRIPSLIAGTLLVLAMYLLLRELEFNHRFAWIGAFITAVNPWPHFLSRIGFESNLALGFFGFGLWALVKMIKTQRRTWTVASAILLALTWYSYVPYRPITLGLVMLVLGGLWLAKQLAWQRIALFGLCFVIAVFPLFLPSAVGSNTTRLKQVGILSDSGLISEINENRTFCDVKLPRLVCDAISNKGTVVGSILMKRFVHTFSPQYLATLGEDGLHFLTVKGYGQFYFILYPFFVIGVLALLNITKVIELPLRNRLLIASGLLLSPLPTILVGDAQKVRISALFPFVLIMIILGLQIAWQVIKQRWLRQLLLVGTLGIVTLNAGAYLVTFMTIHTVKNDYYYQTYLPDLIDFLQQYGPDTDIVIKPFFSDPLMFYAYYTQMDPAFYQENAVLGELEASGFQHTVGLANLHVEDTSLVKVTCRAAEQGKHTIFVTNTKEGDNWENIVYSLNGSLAYVYSYDTQKYLALNPTVCGGATP